MELEIISRRVPYTIKEKRGDSLSNYYISEDGNMHVRNTWMENNSKNRVSVSLFRRCADEIFLPQGYPDSVSDDYIRCRFWFNAQEFCSEINRTLATHAIFKGIGVGDVKSTAVAATITFMLKDGTGMLGRIIFTWWKGFLLDSDCKKWRLVADILYNGTLFLEILLEMSCFRAYSSFLLCLATGLRSIVLVAGTDSYISMLQNQAIRNNMGDVSAKDRSQGTFAHLLGSIFGIFLLTYTTNNLTHLWTLFFVSVLLHIRANYMAVKSLNIPLLNRSRMILVVKDFLRYNTIGYSKVVNKKEGVFHLTALTDKQFCSREINLGCSLKKLLQSRDVRFPHHSWNNLSSVYQQFPYIISYDDKSINVALFDGISEKEIIMAYFHALVLGVIIDQTNDTVQYNSDLFNLIKKCREVDSPATLVNEFIKDKWEKFVVGLIDKGWIIDKHQLSPEAYRLLRN